MRSFVAFAIALSAVTLAGCSTRAPAGSVQAVAGKRRVVSLVPSFADDVYAIGAGSQLVAVSAFTDVPQATRLPRVADASSVDTEQIVALRPSVVIGIPAQSRLTEPLRRANVRVVLLTDDSFQSIFDNLKILGLLTGRERQAKVVVARLQRQTKMLVAQTKGYVRRPSVFIALGSGPIWTAGAASYIATLIRLAGGANAADDLPAAYGEYSAEALVRRQPDLIIAAREVRLDAVLDREPWRSLRAVRLGRVYAVDPDLIERPGPSYNRGLLWLIDRIRPLAVTTP